MRTRSDDKLSMSTVSKGGGARPNLQAKSQSSRTLQAHAGQGNRSSASASTSGRPNANRSGSRKK